MNIDFIFLMCLALHIAGGAIGLLTGLYNIIRNKGGKQHRAVGRIFVYAMLTAGSTSLILAVLHPNYFLFIVGVFTLYMVGTGYRYMRLRDRSKLPAAMDWVLAIVMAVAGVVFIGLGLRSLLQGVMFGLVFMTFGFFGLVFVKQDVDNYRGRARAVNFWLLSHLQRMTGAFIASLTAFLVVNAKYMPAALPSYVYWLLPTLVLVPFIIRWSRRYEIRKAAKMQV
jgi:uncharacterized membrane protein